LRFHRNGEAGLVTEVLNEAPFLEDHRIALEVPLGTLVILNGLLPHLSAANNSKKSRHAYALHVIDGSANYPPDNWLRRDPSIPLRGFL
jgi:phytanoyl-CoA hydroxylase